MAIAYFTAIPPLMAYIENIRHLSIVFVVAARSTTLSLNGADIDHHLAKNGWIPTNRFTAVSGPRTKEPVPLTGSFPTGVSVTPLYQVDHTTLPGAPDGVGPPAGSSTLSHPGHHSSVEWSSITYEQVAANKDAFPQTEYPRRPIEFFGILTDFASTALPLGLVIFTLMLWRLDGTEATDAKYTSWENAITLLATVFPILFASIAGRLMSEAVRLKLERGAALGSLEQLMGSRTVGGTFLTLFSFRFFNILSAGLAMIWALSPLGTQSLLRMMTTRLEPLVTPTNVTYFDNSAKCRLPEITWIGMVNSQDLEIEYRSLASSYIALVAAPGDVKSSSMDLWGNVKIPILNHTEAIWKDVPYANGAFEYSSLAGIPLNHVGDGNTTFAAESSYIQLKCENITNLHSTAITADDARIDLINGTLLAIATDPSEPSDNIFYLPNGTWHGYPSDRKAKSHTKRGAGKSIYPVLTSWSLALDRFVDPVWTGTNNTKLLETDHRIDERNRPVLLRNETGIEVGPTTLMFQALFRGNMRRPPSGLLRAYCRVTQKYVESRITCSRALTSATNAKKSCHVIAQRPSQQQHASEEISHLSFPKVFRLFSDSLPLAVGGSITYHSDISLYHLQDPALGGLTSGEEDILRNVTAEDLGIRLAQILNTYLTLAQVSLQIRGGSFDSRFLPVLAITTPAENSKLVRRFDIAGSWAVTLLVSSFILLAAGVSGVVCKNWAQGPEVLGYVSTVLRDSKHIDFDVKTGQLDGVELSRGMKALRIRYGVTQLIKDQEPLVGVGCQDETMPVRYRRR